MIKPDYKARVRTSITRVFAITTGLILFSRLALPTGQVGYTSTSTRSPIPTNLYASQWGVSPLFNFAMQSSGGTWGYDLIHATNTFAVASGDGTPSQSGWHDHPVPIGLVQVISGGLWIQEHSDLTCLTYYPTGSMFVEGAGHLHNAFNFDRKTPAVTLATWFLERYLTTTRREQPDPVTGSPTVASPPPTALCAGSPTPPAVQQGVNTGACGGSSAQMPPLLRSTAVTQIEIGYGIRFLKAICAGE